MAIRPPGEAVDNTRAFAHAVRGLHRVQANSQNHLSRRNHHLSPYPQSATPAYRARSMKAASVPPASTSHTAFSVNATVAQKLGFASHQNAVPLLRELEIANDSDKTLDDLTLTLTADPPFLSPKTWRLDRLAAGTSLHVNDTNITLSGAFLSDLTESIVGDVRLRLEAGGQELAVSEHRVELLARGEWGGARTMSELLAAFSMPNDPAVDRVLKTASEVLRRAGARDAIDGYESKSRERVWELASAIWSAVVSYGISYALPPASFELEGQKVRSPSAILEGRVGTCLDTALLFAATLEQAGLNPMLVLTRGHAFTGVWLQPVEFTTLITDEAAALRRRIDVQELVVFETTLATQAPAPSFSQAVKTAVRSLAENAPDAFESAIDIRRARMQKIRPLSLVVDGRTTVAVDGTATVNDALEAAPRLPSFDVDIEQQIAGPGGKIALWQRKLLNLTTSNRLLNVPEGGKVIRLVCPSAGFLEDKLAAGRKIRIVPVPDLEAGGRDAKTYEAQRGDNLLEEVARDALERGEVLSALPAASLDAALVELFRKAKSDIDEGGANTLFLALGFLKWKRTLEESKTYRAPLILLPVKLERRSARSGVVMVHHEDEPRFNLTLLELLRQDFEIAIPALEGALPTDESGIDVAGIWSIVRQVVRDIPGFEVTEDVLLGTFSFAKYLMWKDLVDRGEHLMESPIVRHLVDRESSSFAPRGDFPKPERLDALVDPAGLFTPLPADSSQIAAIVASAQGHDFVLDGPPGTGKSQTIANMIAHNLALGRRVLFVAEKMAALDVVQRRLAERGLAEFCLELHSSKASKTDVLKQLDRAWSVRDSLTGSEWEREANEVKRLRDGLNAVVSVLHRRHDNGLTVHAAIGRVVRDWTETCPRPDFPPHARHSEEDIGRLRDIARRLGLSHVDVDGLAEALSGVVALDWSNGWQEGVVAAASDVQPSLDAVEKARAALVASTRLDTGGSGQAGLEGLATLVGAILDTHGRDLRLAFDADYKSLLKTVRAGLELITRYRAEEATLSFPYTPDVIRRLDLVALSADWKSACERFWFLKYFAKKKVAEALRVQAGADRPVDPAVDLPKLTALSGLLAELDALSGPLAILSEWNGLSTDAAEVEITLAMAKRLRGALTSSATDPSKLAGLRTAAEALVVDANAMLEPAGSVARPHHQLVAGLARLAETTKRFESLIGANAAGFHHLQANAAAVLTHRGRLKAWSDWRRVRQDAVAAGLGNLAALVEKGGLQPRDTVPLFETGYARWFASQQIDAEPLLARFVPRVHADDISAFREVDERLRELSVRYIRSKVCGNIPSKEEIGKKDGYAVLKHQLALQRRHKPVRQLAADMGDAFTRLAPCLLMSPLSVAQYLPTDQALFDLVIFDEASQIAPWDAIGAMARGKQVVIAGDPRQMPPTSFFTRAASATEGDTDTEADMESILDECLAAGVPAHTLSWHYRSRHESLIAFSNHRYYDSGLITFPAPVTRESAVEWRRVPGVWARGSSRTNAIEAKAIVDEAVKRLTDPTFIAEGRSLGIITLNADQQRLIEDLLDKARRDRPEIEVHFSDERTEPVVVKNLETVQGDERDLIILGIGFGPTEPGAKTMSMSLGALNGQGGWRRLNVAVTRARQEMLVFTSFEPGMIDLNRTSARAVRDLKHFVEFAERGPRALGEAIQGSVGGFDSPFEEAVSAALVRKGWTVVPQIGVSRFRIDLGVVHPDRPGDYLAGVECDGATYHSAATARDRDKVRQAILEGLGWKLVRLWSTDWWIDKAGATERLHAALNKLLEESRAAAEEAAKVKAAVLMAPMAAVEATPEPASVMPSLVAQGSRAPAPSRVPAAPVMYARSLSAGTAVPYRVADFSEMAGEIDGGQFYEAAYDGVLVRLIAIALEQEGPIAEALLVQRVARAHGFARTGRIIRDRVMTIVAERHHAAADGEGGVFVWVDAEAPGRWDRYRTPKGAEEVRQVEDIAVEELRAALGATSGADRAAEVGRLFGIKRLSVGGRRRIEGVGQP